MTQLELTYKSFQLSFNDDKAFTGLGLNVSTTFTGEWPSGRVGGWVGCLKMEIVRSGNLI